jgi:HD-like signal output (HDOD) protein
VTLAAPQESRTPFEFVSSLASELTRGHVDLPSFPDVTLRLQQALGDPEISMERVARVVGSDAGLTGRVLTMANSTLLHRSSHPVTDIKIAVTRIGQDNIRAAALSYASTQLRNAKALAPVHKELEEYWLESIRAAAMCHAIARENNQVRVDEAMLTGLMHNIGKVYILARSVTGVSLANDPKLREELLRDWHPGVGQALIENWKLPLAVATAVGGQLDMDYQHAGPPDLQDLLIVALLLTEQIRVADGDVSAIVELKSAKKLGLDDSSLVRIVLESQTEVEMLQAALGA